jgi:thiol-disulfide isomerase/thioredoxin
MMKNNLLLLLIFTIALTACKDNSIKISGKIKNQQKGEYLWLQELKTSSLKTIDSVKLTEDGDFSFEEEMSIPTFYLLKTSNSNFLTILAEPGENISVTAEYNKLGNPEILKGSEGTQKMIDYNKALKNTIDKISALQDIYSQNTGSPDLEKVMATLDSTAQTYLREINVFTKKYIDENLKSMVSLVALYQQVAPQVYVMNPLEDLSYFVKVDSSLFMLYPESEPVKALHDQVKELVDRIAMEKGTDAAQPSSEVIPDIALPSPSGEVIKLSSTRGKVVLVDFWAAWCPPCRMENPNLVMAYNTYNSRGFEIFQVSLDKTKDEWVKGIEQDKLDRWIHVSDLKYWNSSVVSQFNIKSIPYNMLLDKDGKVIATNLRGEDLMKKLAEVIK